MLFSSKLDSWLSHSIRFEWYLANRDIQFHCFQWVSSCQFNGRQSTKWNMHTYNPAQQNRDNTVRYTVVPYIFVVRRRFCLSLFTLFMLQIMYMSRYLNSSMFYSMKSSIWDFFFNWSNFWLNDVPVLVSRIQYR